MAHRLTAFAIAALAIAAGPAAAAETLRDPTQPPGAAETGAGGEAAGPVLQAILISPDRKVAIIDGRAVALGGKVGSERLVSISETEVRLKGSEGVRSLRLFPAVEKSAAGSKSPARRPGKSSGKKDKP